MSVKRIYVEKKAPYAVEAKQLLWEIRHILQIKTVTGLRLLNRYDVEGVDDALYQKCLPVGSAPARRFAVRACICWTAISRRMSWRA